MARVVARTKQPLRVNAALVAYHDQLLFQCAYPVNASALAHTDRELRRVARFLRAHRTQHHKLGDGEGLPYVETVARFSHDCVRWLLTHPHCTVALEEFADATLDLNAVLRITLPRLERSLTNAECTNDELFELLRVRPAQRLPFLIAELSRLDAEPLVKDQLFDALGVMVRITPTTPAFSAAFNRLPVPHTFFQAERIKQFDARALIDSPLPPARELTAAARDDVVRVIRNTMTLHTRETDPATYLEQSSLRVYDLERGVSIALFGMTHNRQLALESYIGFTAFKNGMPVSYGGSWILGARAQFGMNIFAPYRGGESGYVMCQLLRAYRQQFGLQYIEVDAHQFGLDNPEGIETGAFWFYYRYGFRPVNRALARLALREKQRLTARIGARSSGATLRKFTQSNVALDLGGPRPSTLEEITARVTRWIAKEHAGDRQQAEQAAVAWLVGADDRAASTDTEIRSRDERDALTELATVACALAVRDSDGLHTLREMVRAKPVDVYRYQSLLTAFLRTR